MEKQKNRTPGTETDAAFWDRVAPRYAKAKIGDQEGYARTLERTQALLGQQDAVLELGCGTGMTALRLAPATASYLATDIAPGMISAARERLLAQPEAKIEFRVETAETVAAPEPGFDAVLGFNYLHLVENLDATLRHIHRLVKPGGLFISKTPCLADMNWLVRVVAALLRLVRLAPSNLLFFTETGLRAAMERAGFDIEAVERHRSKKPAGDKRLYIVARRR